MSLCLSTFIDQFRFSLINIINLVLTQMNSRINFPSPLLRIINQFFFRIILLKYVTFVDSSSHEISMHSRKHKINNLLKIIIEVCLSFLGICSNSILNCLITTCMRSSSRLILSKSMSSYLDATSSSVNIGPC